jgi:hypothetical protein
MCWLSVVVAVEVVTGDLEAVAVRVAVVRQTPLPLAEQ